jgi:hypothetical protein
VLHPQEYRAQQNRLRAVPILGRSLFDGPQGTRKSGVIEEDIEAAKFRDRPADGRLDLSLDADIGFLKKGASAAACRAIPHHFFSTRRVQVGNYDRRPLGREANRRAAAYSACRARDERDFLIESAHDSLPVN